MKIDGSYLPSTEKPTKKASKYIDYLTYKAGIKTDAVRAGYFIGYMLTGKEHDGIFSATSDKPATYKQRKYINYLLYYSGKLTRTKYIYLMSRLYQEQTA